MQRTRREQVFQDRIITVSTNDFLTPDGRELKRTIVEHPGAAVIIPLVAPGEVLMVEQYRFGANRRLLEFPAGMMEPGEDPRAAAARECAEETGMRPKQLELLFSMYPSPAFLSEQLHIFLATELEPDPDAKPDHDEDITVSRMMLADLKTHLRVGNIKNGATVAALGYLFTFKPGLAK